MDNSLDREREGSNPRGNVAKKQGIVKNHQLLSPWEQVLLFEALRKGPNGQKNSSHWVKTMNKLARLVSTDQPVLWDIIFNPSGISDNWSKEQLANYQELVKAVREGIDAYCHKDGSPANLEALADAVHTTLSAQWYQERSEEELVENYLTAGRLVKSDSRKRISWMRDAHGIEFALPTQFVEERELLEVETVERESGRRLKSDQCVRLITDTYEGFGMPKGAVGYVLHLVSNASLKREANYCQVMFILEYDNEDQSYTEEYLEVTDTDLELCDRAHQPPSWFPFVVSGNGVVNRVLGGSFHVSPTAESYTYEDLFKKLSASEPIEGERSESANQTEKTLKERFLTGLDKLKKKFQSNMM